MIGLAAGTRIAGPNWPAPAPEPGAWSACCPSPRAAACRASRSARTARDDLQIIHAILLSPPAGQARATGAVEYLAETLRAATERLTLAAPGE